MKEANELAENMEYKLIIKYAVMHEAVDNLGIKTCLVRNKREFYNIFNKLSENLEIEKIIFQEYIPGPTSSQVGVSSVKTKDLFMPMSLQYVKRRGKGVGTVNCLVKTVSLPNLESFTNYLLDKFGIDGISEVEYKYDYRDKTYKLIEINPRPWLQIGITNLLPDSFPKIFSDLIFSKVNSLDTSEEIKYDELVWIDKLSFFNEFSFAHQSILGLYKSGAKVYEPLFDKEDPLPMLFYSLIFSDSKDEGFELIMRFLFLLAIPLMFIFSSMRLRF